MQLEDLPITSRSFPQIYPLIDVLFLLLVFFMLTTTFEEMEQKAIDVELPFAEKSEVLKANRTLSVVITRSGTYRVEGKACDKEDLVECIEQYYRQGKKTLLITVDRQAPSHAVVNLYDVMQVLGVSQFTHEVRDIP